MNRILIITLAASAFAPVPALAQSRTVQPPVKWEDVPHAQMRVPGHHVGKPHAAPHATPGPQMRKMEVHRAPTAHAAPPPVVKHHGPVRAHGAFDRTIVRHHRGGHSAWRGHRGLKNYSHYRRIDRGFGLPQAWWGPRYQIHNWSMYGLPAPIHGGRWVRYYDDALMVDGYGRVHDGRWGMAWDDWQDQWAYDDRGVPAYVGEGDFYPGDEDYAWVEGERGRYAEGYDHGGSYAHGHGYGHAAPCAQGCPVPPPPYPYGHGYGWGHGYGYGAGWGYGAAMVVTETTVTTSPTIVTETWIEEEVVHERRAKKARKYKAKPRYRAPKPRPYGERG